MLHTHMNSDWKKSVPTDPSTDTAVSHVVFTSCASFLSPFIGNTSCCRVRLVTCAFPLQRPQLEKLDYTYMFCSSISDFDTHLGLALSSPALIIFTIIYTHRIR